MDGDSLSLGVMMKKLIQILMLSLVVAMSAQAAPSAELKQKLATIEKEKINYPSRADDMGLLNAFLEEGRYDLANGKADIIIKQQRNLQESKKAGLPAELKQKLATIDKEKINYPSRADDMSQLNLFLADGLYDLANGKADMIIKQQRNLQGSKKAGLPAELKQKLATIDKEKINYPSRAGDMGLLNSFLTDGLYDLANGQADTIITQQRNLRN